MSSTIEFEETMAMAPTECCEGGELETTREGVGEAPPARLRHREEPRRRRRRLLVEDDQAAVRGEGTGAEVG